jgi:methylated-DNA-[protein]-cysteine S-methyltransferase
MRYTFTESPLGSLLLIGDDDGLTRLYRQDSPKPGRADPAWQRDETAFPDVREQLAEYFTGTRQDFTMRLNLTGAEFHRRVWQFLGEIPYGETTTYGGIATALGTPGAARAVGMANARNPIPIIIPCHRVVGADGSLTGYGGGLPMKRYLLSLEASHVGLFAR